MTHQKFNRIVVFIIAVILICTMLLAVACETKNNAPVQDNNNGGGAVGSGDNTNGDTNIGSGDIDTPDSGDNNPSGDDQPSSGDNDNPSSGDSNTDDEKPQVPEPVAKSIMLDELSLSYSKVGHGNLTINKDNNGDKLSLLVDGQETVFEHGIYAHAYSVLVIEGVETLGFNSFSTVIGVNKTARVSNTQTSIVFRILVDNEQVFESNEFDAYTDSQYVEIDVRGAERLTLIADSVGANGHDHAVWADCQFGYFDNIKPYLQVYDVEFPSPYAVTNDNILEIARAKSFEGVDLSDDITYTTNYVAGKTGEFYITYQVSDGVAVAEKTIKMTVLSDNRFEINADLQYLSQPFADFVYYGRSLLSKESRKAYDLIMEKLLAVDLADSSINTLTVDLQSNGIYIFPNEVAKIKKYLVYDETRLYYIYNWREGETGGVSYTQSNGFVNTVTIKLYNGTGGYYYGHNNSQVWQQAESKIEPFFAKLTYDMTEAQLLYSVQNSYCPTISYSNENYADGFYGAFITNRCICSGYSKGYSYLAQRLGIRVAYVVGTAGGAHAWNYLFADGDWYMTDTTWGNGNSFGLLGKSYMDSAGRYDYSNYGTMPELSQNRYDLDLMKYPLMSIKNGYMMPVGQELNLEELVIMNGAIRDKAPLVAVEYTGELNLNTPGEYSINVKATNSLGNVVSGVCEVFVYGNTQQLNSIIPTQSGNSNYAIRSVSLYYGGQEKAFDNGIYTKANGTLTLSFDVSSMTYRYLSGYVGIDKVIRDNKPWGEYANATVKVLADNQVLFQKSGIGWKTEMTYFAVKIPQGTNTIKLEITDNTGQGGVGWGDCLLYE